MNYASFIVWGIINMKNVTFCGHSKLSEKEKILLKKELNKKLEKLISNGACTFLLGGYGDFDRICAYVIRELKKQYSHIESVFVTPYINKEYNTELYDGSEYPPIENVPLRYAISKRNEYMVEKADVIIAYVNHSWGGAATTLEYAKRKHKNIQEL